MTNSNFLAGCQAKGGLTHSTQVVKCFYLPRQGELTEKLKIRHELVKDGGIPEERFSMVLANGRECMEYWRAITKAITAFMMRAYNKDIKEIAEILNHNAKLALADAKESNPTKQQTLEVSE